MDILLGQTTNYKPGPTKKHPERISEIRQIVRRRIGNRSPRTQPIGPRNQPHRQQLTISEVISAQRKRTTSFANYYRRFIKDFSKIANPLIELTKKDKPFTWNNEAQEAFDGLKQAILSEPVLAMFDLDKEIELETDSSDFALGGQIGQQDDTGKLHPIAFYLYKLHRAELNYLIYDKEFLAIINYFKEFRHYLIRSKHQVKVYTDHQNISYFATIHKLNRRQLRYAEYLCEFDFIIIYRKGSENGRNINLPNRCKH
ncbi:Uncharacterized protein HZ326_28025 [Fusarium oxysporum f. sp. albedinis]|nr:Uncharacterized protein HZ326_28025 [Fusarium oxysporum f. sp. albedinis]